jgi:DNA repair protein RecN (Recombination protein N)
MPECRVDVRLRRFDRPENWTTRGIDAVEIFLSPNPGEELRPLVRIASGGELSRVMLALHTLAAIDEGGRTLIFDEVDAGIGGAAADAVGARLQALGRRDQVLCITHLPQIAARADAHFALTKTVRAGRTVTTAARLDQTARELEVARMIAGVEVSPQVLASARELLRTRRGSESESEHRTKGESGRPAKAKARRA